MKTREEVARVIDSQLAMAGDDVMFYRKNQKIHYGLQELKDLMDFIYEGAPKSEEEKITHGGSK